MQAGIECSFWLGERHRADHDNFHHAAAKTECRMHQPLNMQLIDIAMHTSAMQIIAASWLLQSLLSHHSNTTNCHVKRLTVLIPYSKTDLADWTASANLRLLPAEAGTH